MSLVASAHQRMMMKKKLEKKRAEGGGGGGGGVAVSPVASSSGVARSPSSGASSSFGVRISPTATTSADPSSPAAPAVDVASPPQFFDGSQRPPPPPPPPPPSSSSSHPTPTPPPTLRPSLAQQRPSRMAAVVGGGTTTGASLVVGGGGINTLSTNRQPGEGNNSPSGRAAPAPPHPPPPRQLLQPSPPAPPWAVPLPAYYERRAPDSDYEEATRPRGRHTNYLGPRDEGRVPNRRRRGYDSFLGKPSTSTTSTSSPSPDGRGGDGTTGAAAAAAAATLPAPPVLGDAYDFEYHADRDEAFDDDDDDDRGDGDGGGDGDGDGGEGDAMEEEEGGTTTARPPPLGGAFVADDGDCDDNAEGVVTHRASTDVSRDMWAENSLAMWTVNSFVAFDGDDDDITGIGGGRGLEEKDRQEDVGKINSRPVPPPPPPLLLPGRGFNVNGNGGGRGLEEKDRQEDEGKINSRPPPPPLLPGRGFIINDGDNDDEEVSADRVSTDSSVEDGWAGNDTGVVAPLPRGGGADSPDSDNRTVDSETALVGTPVRKKNKGVWLQPPTPRDPYKTPVADDEGDSMVLLVEGKPPKSPNEDSQGNHLNSRRMPTLVVIEDDVVRKHSAIHRRAVGSPQDESDAPSGATTAAGGNKRGSISSSRMHDIAADADRHRPRMTPPPTIFGRSKSGNNDNSSRNRNVIGISKSWDSPAVSGFPDSADAFASYGNGGVGNNDSVRKTPSSFFSSSFWGDGDDDNNSASRNVQRQLQLGDLTRTSKSWDEGWNGEQRTRGGYDGVGGTVDDNLATCGTWGEQSASLFSDIETAQSGSLFNGIVLSSASDENLGRVRGGSDKENLNDIDLDLFVPGQRIPENADELGEWEKAELHWRKNMPRSDNDVTGVVSPPTLTTPAVAKKSHPWNSDFELENSELDLSVFGTVRGEERIRSGKSRSAPRSEVEESDIEFVRNGNRMRAKQETGTSIATSASVAPPATANTKKESWQQPIPSLVDPEDIFEKIKGSLKQADKAKNRALGKQVPSDGSNDLSFEGYDLPPLTTVVQSSSSGSPMSAAPREQDKKKMTVKSIRFVSDEENTVHTYLKEPDESNYESDRYDDEDEGNEEENNLLQSSQPPTSRITNFGEAACSISPKRRAATYENEERSDADTCEDSTIADSITCKSALDDDFRTEDFDIFTDLRKDVDDAVNAVVATLGGLFGVAQASKSGNKTVVRPTNDHDGDGDGRGDGVVAVGVSRSALNDEDKSVLTDDNDTYDESRTQSTAQWTLATGETTNTEAKSENNWLGYMRHILSPNDVSSFSVMLLSLLPLIDLKYSFPHFSLGSQPPKDGASARCVGTKDDDMFDAESTYQEEEDNYLLLQALAAARAIHHVQGVDFNEKNEINVLTDIKFVVVTVALPLGREFVCALVLFFFSCMFLDDELLRKTRWDSAILCCV
jgi:hypothetical protein